MSKGAREQGSVMEFLVNNFNLSDAVLIAAMGWLISGSRRDRKEFREDIRDLRQDMRDLREEMQAGFAAAKAARQRGFDKAERERQQIREEAKETNKRLVWIGEQVAWLRGRHDYPLEDPAA